MRAIEADRVGVILSLSSPSLSTSLSFSFILVKNFEIEFGVFECVLVLEFCTFCALLKSLGLFDEFNILVFVFEFKVVFVFNGFGFNGFEKLSSVIMYHLQRSEMTRWRKAVW